MFSTPLISFIFPACISTFIFMDQSPIGTPVLIQVKGAFNVKGGRC